MTQPPETILVETHRVSCDGASAIRGGAEFRPAALGHPRFCPIFRKALHPPTCEELGAPQPMRRSLAFRAGRDAPISWA
jgi:hypothetical protein